MAGKKKNNFYVQGSILAAASILTRIMGIGFRIPLTRIIGDEGIGAYSNAYENNNTVNLFDIASIRRESAPSCKEFAYFSSFSLLAEIISITASARVKSILPFKNARLVNSPGSASFAPQSKQQRKTRCVT